MRSPTKTSRWQTLEGSQVQICCALPHQFVLNNQQQLLPTWDVAVTTLILVLQESSISLRESNLEVAQEKDNLRAKFIRFGCDLVFLLGDRGYLSDLFDPRTGYPLLAQPGKSRLDDNAVIKAILNYPLISYYNCSLIVHPTWGNNVYPSTVVTSAPAEVVNLIIKQVSANQSWREIINT